MAPTVTRRGLKHPYGFLIADRGGWTGWDALSTYHRI
jgi:hypothetical protein